MDRRTKDKEDLKREREYHALHMSSNPIWAHCRHIQRTHLHHGRVFVVWDVVDGAPRIHNVYKVANISINWGMGLCVVLESAQGSRSLHVTSHPNDDILGVFLWLPMVNETRMMPMNPNDPSTTRRLGLGICIQTSTPELLEGSRHMTPMKEFNKAWPGIFEGQ